MRDGLQTKNVKLKHIKSLSEILTAIIYSIMLYIIYNNIITTTSLDLQPRLFKKVLVQFNMVQDEGHFGKSSHCQILKF